jgi:kumamolisin
MAQAVSNPHNPLYRHYLSYATIQQRFGPSAQAVAMLAAWLQSHNITNCATRGTLMLCRAYVSTLQAAFSTQIANWRLPGGRVFFAPTQAPAVPATISTLIYGVIGLDNQTVYQPQLQRPQLLKGLGSPRKRLSSGQEELAGESQSIRAHPNTTFNYPSGGYTPSLLRSAYDTSNLIANGLDGSGQVIDLYELDGYNSNNVAQYDHTNNLSTGPLLPITCSSSLDSSGNINTQCRPNSLMSPQSVDGEGEVESDIEVIHAMAPAAAVHVWMAPPDIVDRIGLWSAMIQQHDAPIISSSWGTCELDTEPVEIQDDDMLFQTAVTSGIGIYAASGDSGSYGCHRNSNSPNVDAISVGFPPSDPNVTGVGGTALGINNDGSYSVESAWNDLLWTSNSFPWVGGGGGVSSDFSPAWYQNFGETGRAVPDVSADADLVTGYAVYTVYCTQPPPDCTLTSGSATGPTEIGGTSLATPLWAAVMAEVNQAGAQQGLGPLGFANPVLYAVAESNAYASAFHDVTLGNNDTNPNDNGSIYPAGQGYDLATGWGSMDGANLIAALLPSSPTPTPVNPTSTVTVTWTPMPLTATATSTKTPIPTSTPSSTSTPVPPTATATATKTPIPTNTPSSTNTPVPPTATATATKTPIPTNTPVPTHTYTPIPANTNTNTPVPTHTYTPIPANTNTNTVVPATSTFTPVPTSTNTPVPTHTYTPIPVNTNTNTVVPATSTFTPVPTSTNTPVPTHTYTPIPANTNTNTVVPATSTFTPVPTHTYTPIPVNTNTNTPVPSSTPACITPGGAPSVGPITVTNLSGTGFVVTFTSSSPAVAILHYGTAAGSLNSTVRDDRDTSTCPNGSPVSTVHRFTIPSLTPGATYYFAPVVNSTLQSAATSHVSIPTGLPVAPPPPAIVGQVVISPTTVPAANTVLVTGHFHDPSNGDSLPISVFAGSPNSNGYNYVLQAAALTASGNAYYQPTSQTTFIAQAAGDDQGQLGTASPVSATVNGPLIIMPRLTLLNQIMVTIPFTAGQWDLFSLPVTTSTTAETVLQTLLTQVGFTSAQLLPFSGGTWQPGIVYNSAVGFLGTDFPLQVGQGYALYFDKVTTGASPSLTFTGLLAPTPTWTLPANSWGLVSLPYSVTPLPSAEAVLTDMQTKTGFTSAQLLLFSGGTWQSGLVYNAAVGFLGTDFTLQVGQAYALFTNLTSTTPYQPLSGSSASGVQQLPSQLTGRSALVTEPALALPDRSEPLAQQGGMMTPLVTDRRDTSFAVALTTSSAAVMTLQIGSAPGQLTLATVHDDRTNAQGDPASTVHRFTLQGLAPNTTYYFEPVVNGMALTDLQGQPFAARTTATPAQPYDFPALVLGSIAPMAGSGMPGAGSVLLVGHWTNPDGARSADLSFFNGGGTGTNGGAIYYDMPPALVDAVSGAPFLVQPGATFTVTAYADNHGTLLTAPAATSTYTRGGTRVQSTLALGQSGA